MMKYTYRTESHYEKMKAAFPWWINRFSKKLGNSWLHIVLSEWEYENKDGVQLSLWYEHKDFFPEHITTNIDNKFEHFRACKIWLFFDDKDVIISSIQWQSFSDTLWKALLERIIDKSVITSEKAFNDFESSFINQKDNIQIQLIKKFWMPQHDFLFILGSLVGVALGGEKIKFIKKQHSESIYALQEPRNDKLQKKIPALQDGENCIYRDKDQIIDYVGRLPGKQQELLFWLFDNLQSFINKEGNKPMKDLSDETKGALIGTIRHQRKKNRK